MRWEFVTQRPQHVIGRFKNNRIFIEEPVHLSNSQPSHIFKVGENLSVVQPKAENYTENVLTIVKEFLESERVNPILWFYSPAFYEFADKIPHSLIVYDCMDELSAFKGASEQLITQEKELLKRADIVFTGGKSLYEAKSKLHPHVYCYPSSVDKNHFQKALEESTIIPDDIQNIPTPIVSYIGVIDERINLELLDNIARQRSDISLVMIGPVVKIDPHTLPGHPNIYYLGQKPYSLLPAYLKATTVAMMPFALNESTRFISPTKTLEYIAAHKPILSTPIRDVTRDYAKYIAICENAGQFLSAVDMFISETERDRCRRIQKYHQLLDAVSWDKTVTGMKKKITELLKRKAETILNV